MSQRREEFRQRRRQLHIDQNEASPEVVASRPRAGRSIRTEDTVRETTDDEYARQAQPRLPTAGATSGPASVRQMLRRNLATQGGLRQAIVLNDVLGPPKALRRQEDV